MAEKVIMPRQGLQMVEGTIIKWLKEEGAPIKCGEPLLTIETDKVTMDIDAPSSGILLKILHGDGSTVPVAETIALIGEKGEDIAGAAGEKAAKDGVHATPRARKTASESGIDLKGITPSGPHGLIIERDITAVTGRVKQVYITPLAKKTAELNCIDTEKITGTGPYEKITRSDILVAVREREINTGTIPLSGMRRAIARHMTESLHTAAQANHRMTVDMSETLRMKDRLKENGIKVSVTDILICMSAHALKEHPVINSTLTPDGIRLNGEINIGVAVALEDGLLVPVIKNADRLPLCSIHPVVAELVQKAKNGKLLPGEVTGGSFTVTNLGMYEIDSFTAIINQPESAILAVGKIADAFVPDDSGRPILRSMLTLSLTYDHRIIDGAPAARFLQTMKKMITNPYLLV